MKMRLFVGMLCLGLSFTCQAYELVCTVGDLLKVSSEVAKTVTKLTLSDPKGDVALIGPVEFKAATRVIQRMEALEELGFENITFDKHDDRCIAFILSLFWLPIKVMHIPNGVFVGEVQLSFLANFLERHEDIQLV